MSDKKYTLAQLRGAFVAGQKKSSDRIPDRSKPESVSDRAKRKIDWAERELWSLVELHGPALAFSRTKPSFEWIQCVFVMLKQDVGSIGFKAHLEVIDRIERRLERVYGDTFEVGYGIDCLDNCFQEFFARRENIVRQFGPDAVP